MFEAPLEPVPTSSPSPQPGPVLADPPKAPSPQVGQSFLDLENTALNSRAPEHIREVGDENITKFEKDWQSHSKPDLYATYNQRDNTLTLGFVDNEMNEHSVALEVNGLDSSGRFKASQIAPGSYHLGDPNFGDGGAWTGNGSTAAVDAPEGWLRIGQSLRAVTTIVGRVPLTSKTCRPRLGCDAHLLLGNGRAEADLDFSDETLVGIHATCKPAHSSITDGQPTMPKATVRPIAQWTWAAVPILGPPPRGVRGFDSFREHDAKSSLYVFRRPDLGLEVSFLDSPENSCDFVIGRE